MTTETTVMGSLAPIPYNSRAIRRVSPNANASPSASPMPVSHNPCNSTSRSTSTREAPRRHSYSDLVGSHLGSIGHDSVDPGYRKNQPDQREHSRQGALDDGETARHLGTLSHGTHIENRQPCIDFVDGVFHRWRQVDRISLGLHLHDRLVPRSGKSSYTP